MGRGEQPGSEVTAKKIEDLRNGCVREMEDHLNRRLLGNYKEVNKGCYRKKKSHV